jgi:serine/threonine-protein kinase
MDSPHIVGVLDSGTDSATGSLYLVMEYLEGEDLQRLLERVGALEPDVGLRIAGQALLGLVDAHAVGIIHRDIKPGNLFLARTGDGTVSVKVLDFGIAKMRKGPLQYEQSTGLTATGGFLGSPRYMSPEQVQSSKDVDPRSDVWSVGCVLYRALAGEPPHRWSGNAIGRLIVAICRVPAPRLSERAPWVTAEVEVVVHGALEIDLVRRTPSAGAMLDAIRALTPGGFALREEMLAGVGAEKLAALVDIAKVRQGAEGPEDDAPLPRRAPAPSSRA